MTLVNPARMEAKQTAGLAPWSWWKATGTSGYASSAARSRWRMNGSPAYFRAPADTCTIAGLSVSRAASMTAWICSRLFTLKAGRP